VSRQSSAEHTETLSLAGIEPVDLLGHNDRNLKLIESRLPGRVVVRGDQVILSGPQRDVQELKRVFLGLIEPCARSGSVRIGRPLHDDLGEHSEPPANWRASRF
jgi:phosphate starvation-inducible protein PhoH